MSDQFIESEVPRPRDNIVTPASFPLPDRANTFAHGQPTTEQDTQKLEGLRGFALRQAEAANGVVNELESLDHSPTAGDWHHKYQRLVDWRYDLAVESGGHRFGKGFNLDAERIRRPITDESPNRDRIGSNMRLRSNPQWDETLQTWVGGEPTPSSEIMEAIGRLVTERFDDEGNTTDELQNVVRLPDGRQVDGNRLVRGKVARGIALDLKEQVQRERGDNAVRQFDTGGDIMFTITASEANRAEIFNAAMSELARIQRGQATFDTWANNAYLLYQGIQNKRGSDAVIRTFAVGAGAYLLGHPPVLPQDIDLRAYAMSQDRFIDYMRTTTQVY